MEGYVTPRIIAQCLRIDYIMCHYMEEHPIIIIEPVRDFWSVDRVDRKMCLCDYRV